MKKRSATLCPHTRASLCQTGPAFAAPDSGGKGVHFSGPGLRKHAARWAEKVAPWLERQVK